MPRFNDSSTAHVQMVQPSILKSHKQSKLIETHFYHLYSIITLSNPAVGETVLTPVKWCSNAGEVPVRIKKSMDEQTNGKKLLFSLILYKRLQ